MGSVFLNMCTLPSLGKEWDWAAFEVVEGYSEKVFSHVNTIGTPELVQFGCLCRYGHLNLKYCDFEPTPLPLSIGDSGRQGLC